MHRVLISVISILVTAQALATTQSFPGVTLLQHPGGGTIAYAQMPAQHTAQGALGKVLQYVTARFGAKPTVTHVLKSKDGNSLAVTFTVKATTETPGDMTGLALVAVTASGPGKGAVLSDQSSRFGTTVADMLQQMQQAAPGARATADLASGAAGSPSGPAASGPAPSAPAATPTSTSTKAAAASTPSPAAAATAAPIGPLHTTAFPDGSGSIGLPDGWKISGAHAGEVIAMGPAPASLHFDFLISAYDPSRYKPNIATSQTMRAIPYDADAATKMSLQTQQISKLQHKAPPTVQTLKVQELSAGTYVLVQNVSPSDGSTPFQAWTEMTAGPMASQGLYTLFMYQILLPQNLTDTQSTAAAKALFDSYHANAQVAQQELAADKASTDKAIAAIQAKTAQNQQQTDMILAANERSFRASQQSFAADDNQLLGNTVIRDRDYNAHGVVSDNLAAALTQADPNRFQEVPASQYVQGVDF